MCIRDSINAEYMGLVTDVMLFAYVYNSPKLINLAAYFITFQYFAVASGSEELMKPIVEEDFKKKCASRVYDLLYGIIQKQQEVKYASINYGRKMKKVKKLVVANVNTKELIEFINSLIPKEVKNCFEPEEVQKVID
eukprot:TRINITY_DN14148_c0_g2_i7.p1 TRINITY_DN14148_c0_g2~~TRINITY_DN14148_c0_g2_i7.p1  ORF type:complete len:137 (+),score=34.74 TRINITY_DN14148_c0_g2_i7:73-483(+)